MTGGITRRAALIGGGALATQAALAATRATPPAFSWEWLQGEALRIAGRPYVAPPPASAAAHAIGYDGRDDIAFRADRTLLGRGGGAGVRLFSMWKLASQPINIALVEHGVARAVPFSRDFFTHGASIPRGAEGFSGFRVMTPDGRSDWLAFQGASYFRAAGALDQYGLSARALAINSGLPEPEEFPRFSRFWLEPGSGNTITIYALLDSPSVAGAWRFVNTHGADGVTQQVSCVLQLRRDVARLGIAPLTSMFWYGEGNRAQAIDWRPEIHDSDGLALLTGRGERLWRPLNNPPGTLLSSFADSGPRGFGLLQRDRAFDHYQDDGVFYERRPSLWVEPAGDWGPGTVDLVELPTRRETDDNVVAFWRPAAPARAGQRLLFDYRLRWIAGEPAPAAAAVVVDSWRGVAGPPGSEPIADATRLVADFVGPALRGLGTTSGVTPHVQLSHGTPLHVVAYPLATAPDRWRLIVDVAEPHATTTDLRAFLARGRDALTETLLYQFVPGGRA